MAKSSTVTVPTLTAIPGSDLLRHLILYDFEEWIKKSKGKLILNAEDIAIKYQEIGIAFATSCAMTTTAQAATASAVASALVLITTLYPAIVTTAPNPTTVTAAPNPTTEPQTILIHLFTALGLKYDK
jgi:hypothetical protein